MHNRVSASVGWAHSVSVDNRGPMLSARFPALLPSTRIVVLPDAVNYSSMGEGIVHVLPHPSSSVRQVQAIWHAVSSWRASRQTPWQIDALGRITGNLCFKRSELVQQEITFAPCNLRRFG